MPSEEKPTRPQTPFEKYFFMSEEEKKRARDASRPLTALEAAHRNPPEKDPTPIEPRNVIEKYFNVSKPQPPPRELTEVEKNFGKKAAEPVRELTALEKNFSLPKPEPLPRELTYIERLFQAPKQESPPRELTATEKIFAARRAEEAAQPQPKPELKSEPQFESCSTCNGTGRVVFLPDRRGLINKAPCNDCQGRGKVPKKD